MKQENIQNERQSTNVHPVADFTKTCYSERRNGLEKQEKTESTQQNIDFTTSSESFRPLQDLNLIDDYMFDIATMDLETCKSIIELSLNIRIQEIRWQQSQKVIHNLPGKRGIRLDFYVRDINGTVFNVEMQKRNGGNLPKRTRYYSALLDAPLLKKGEKQFDQLPETYIIVICGFDLFKKGKYRYRFRYHCDEEPDLILQNGLTVVFLNTKGRNDVEVEPELIAFLRFVENSTAEEAHQSKDLRIQEMYGKINTLKNSEAVEADYMTAEEYKRMITEEAQRIGMQRGRQLKLISLVMRKIAKGCTPAQTADMLEEDPALIQRIYDAIEQTAPEHDMEKIYDLLAEDPEE